MTPYFCKWPPYICPSLTDPSDQGKVWCHSSRLHCVVELHTHSVATPGDFLVLWEKLQHCNMDLIYFLQNTIVYKFSIFSWWIKTLQKKYDPGILGILKSKKILGKDWRNFFLSKLDKHNFVILIYQLFCFKTQFCWFRIKCQLLISSE